MSNFHKQAVWNVPLSATALSPEYALMIQDLVRMFVIQFSIQFMLFLTDSERYAFFSAEFAILLIYIAIAVMIYWLLFRKLVSFE